MLDVVIRFLYFFGIPACSNGMVVLPVGTETCEEADGKVTCHETTDMSCYCPCGTYLSEDKKCLPYSGT